MITKMKKKIRAIKIWQFIIIHSPFKNRRVAEELVKVGNSGTMELFSNAVTEGNLTGMKIRQAWNNEDKHFFLQITDKETMRSMRVILTLDEYRAYANHAQSTINLTLMDNDNKS